MRPGPVQRIYWTRAESSPSLERSAGDDPEPVPEIPAMGPTTHDLPIRGVLISFVLLALCAIATIVAGLAV